MRVNMKSLVTIATAALCTQLAGCFVFIPGQVVGAISDTITGDKGEHCVSRAAKVGDLVRDPFTGLLYSVTSLSGTSSRCNNPAIPVRAELALLPEQARAQTAAPAAAPPAAAPPAPTQADREAACAAMAAVKPGAPHAEWQAAWESLRRLGMTYRDCKK